MKSYDAKKHTGPCRKHISLANMLTALKSSIECFFSKCAQIRRYLRIG